MTTIAYAHINFTADGIPYVTGTTTKVEEIVLDHLAHGWDATEIHRQHPYLTLAQIYSALAYYYDHRPEIDTLIENGLRQVATIQASMPPSPIRMKLQAQGLLK